MDLKVIGAGFGRTGTLSLKAALEQLGFGPCYHMMEVFRNPGHSEAWHRIAKDESDDWRGLLANFQSVVDWPTTYFYKAFVAAYPDAKVILSVRRDGESWYKSASDTIFHGLNMARAGDPARGAQMEMARYVVFDRTFDNDISKDHAIAVYNRHNDEVRRTIAKDKLLVYRSEEGWEPLCRFLGVAVPAAPYPKTNTTEEFRSRIAQREK